MQEPATPRPAFLDCTLKLRYAGAGPPISTTDIRATSTVDGLDTVILNPYDNMTVDSVADDGAPIASGVYFARLVADSGTASRKLLLVR